MNKTKILIAAVATLCVGCTQKPKQISYRVIPLPQEITEIEGKSFTLSEKTTIAYPADNQKMQRNAEFLSEYIAQTTEYTIKTTTKITDNNQIILETGLDNTNPEAYQLTVDKNNITIKGATEAGVFYGMQTLRKTLPAKASNDKIELPPVFINDFPRFKYRGFMLDVSRHFSSTQFLKRTIDLLALHNLNHFHIHLTDDQGWRVEIKKYPKLTQIGSIRKSTAIKGKAENQDGIPHSGFYTQDELREIVAYAAERNITIIPEIDLPGHMLAALASYPELGCTGGPYEVWCQWGVSDDVLCAGQEKTFTFIEDVLSEIIDIFPSKYIHIGGDECPKNKWKKCPRCQAKIKELKIKANKEHSAEEYLQSYVIQRVEKFVNSKGRRIIGWDEILEGGIAPDATVMSWRGMDGGTKAAQQGHEVIMTPNTHVYFDYYQTRDRDNEQFAIGGFIDVERVYSLEPVPSILETEKQNLIIGAQANLWNEYLPDNQSREYMMLPRMASLSEVCWTMPEKKNYEDFISRMPKLIDLYEREGFNYAKHLLEVGIKIEPDTEAEVDKVTLSTLGNADIRYTIDGTEPTNTSPLYSQPINIDKSCTLKTAAFRKNKHTKVKSQIFTFNKATLKPIEYTIPVHNNYAYIPAETLVDGIVGDPIFNSGKWVGYIKSDCQCVIDMRKPQSISKVTLNLLIEPGNYIFGAEAVKIEVSDNGKDFKSVASMQEENIDRWKDSPSVTEQLPIQFEPVTARYVRTTIFSVKHMPKWHGAAGEPAWVFVGEIEIN